MNRELRGLDDHIMGTHIRGEESVPHHCPTCGHNWSADMTFDMGGWFYVKDDDALCHECGEEGEIIEEE